MEKGAVGKDRTSICILVIKRASAVPKGKLATRRNNSHHDDFYCGDDFHHDDDFYCGDDYYHDTLFSFVPLLKAKPFRTSVFVRSRYIRTSSGYSLGVFQLGAAGKRYRSGDRHVDRFVTKRLL